MSDYDLRVLRYFLAVVEHQHFGRAAEQLRIAQPSLSRQIQQLETKLGVRLLERNARGVKLTDAGQAFLPYAHKLLSTAALGRTAALRAAAPTKLSVGFTAGIAITPAVSALHSEHPDAEVTSVHLNGNEARTALIDGQVDVAITRLPFPTDALEVTVLYEEPRVLLVAADHRLAGKEEIFLDDIADEPVPLHDDPDWDAFWNIDPRPDGHRPPQGPLVRSVEEKLELVAQHRVVSLLPADAAAAYVRPDLTVIPLADVPPAQVVLAHRADDRRRLTTAFRTSAQTHMRRPQAGRTRG